MGRKISRSKQSFRAFRTESIKLTEIQSTSIIIPTDSRKNGGRGHLSLSGGTGTRNHFNRNSMFDPRTKRITFDKTWWPEAPPSWHHCNWADLVHLHTTMHDLRGLGDLDTTGYQNCRGTWRRWPQEIAKVRNISNVSWGKCFNSSPFHPSTPADPDWSRATLMTSSIVGSCRLASWSW